MSIFQGIAPNLGETSIRLAASAMLDRAEVLHLASRRWSLTELEFDESDYEWLAGWSQALDDETVRRCLNSWGDAGITGRRMDFQAAVGLVFLALFSEVGRRHASEGWLWGRVVGVAFGDEPPGSAFVQGQPSSLLKEALENAARVAGLRHMFGVEGVQNWFRSVYLQFGFTQTGFEQRLPEWLAGQLAPVSVESLLSDSDLHSDTFASLWHALANLRRKNIGEDSVEQCCVHRVGFFRRGLTSLWWWPASGSIWERHWENASATQGLPLFSAARRFAGHRLRLPHSSLRSPISSASSFKRQPTAWWSTARRAPDCFVNQTGFTMPFRRSRLRCPFRGRLFRLSWSTILALRAS